MEFSNLENMKFYDYKRQYQIPPNHDAYAVICYDDELTDDHDVVNIMTGEIIDFKSFISLIKFSSLTEKEIDKTVGVV